jgi:hypothetical protein
VCPGSGALGFSNFTLTKVEAVTFTTHVGPVVPLQPPGPQAAKVEPAAGLAVSVTLPGKACVQVDGHESPAGELVTVPFPEP